MPNGHREPYRLFERPCSPNHSSDSEETATHKHRFFLAVEYGRRWRARARAQRIRRTRARAYLLSLVRRPDTMMHLPVPVVLQIADFM